MGLYTLWQPDASTFIETDNEVVRKLQNGDPTIGWRGDPNMELAYNKKTRRIELWRNGEDGQWKLLAESNPGVRVLNTEFLLWVRDHDPTKGYNAWEEVEKRNAKVRAEKEAKEKEEIHEASERIAYEIRKRS